jgi:SAM-dependent methyltransferase
MTEFNALCPACRGRVFNVLGHKNGFEMRSCGACRTLTAVGDYSADGSLYEEIYAKPPQLTIGARAGLRRILDRLRSTNLSGRLLDYGFGAGDLMREARDAGWQVCGVEYSDNARSRALAEGFEVVKEASALSRKDYDVVTMIEVIEHLPNARQALEEAFDLLRPGGALYVTTPNARGLNPRYLGLNWSVVGPPDHRVLFSRSGLTTLAQAVGFRVEFVRTEGLNPSEWRVRNKRPEVSASQSPAPAANLNDQVEASGTLRMVKRVVNALLSVFGLGDTVKMMARRP